MRLMMIDNDVDFRRRFSEYLAEGCGDIAITVCGDAEAEAELASPVDLILYDERISGEIKQALEKTERKRIALVWDVPETRGKTGSETGIYKFQSAAGIAAEIPELREIMAFPEWLSEKKKETELICVTGFTGGCGRTSVSLTLARLIRERTGQGVLIVSMGEASDLTDYFSEPAETEGKNAPDMNLLLLSFASDTPVHGASFLLKDRYGVSVIRPPKDYKSDFHTLSGEELLSFLNFLKGWNAFQTVILDMDAALHARNRMIYEMADHVVLLTDDRRCTGSCWKRWFQEIADAASTDKITQVINFDIANELGELIFAQDADFSSDHRIHCSLPADPDSFSCSGTACEISMSGAFAAGVSNVYKELCRK